MPTHWWERTSDSAVEPVATTAMQAHVHQASTADTPVLEAVTSAARETFEDDTGQALINQNWRLHLSDFPVRERIDLPRVPVNGSSNVSISFFKEGSTSSTSLSSTAYWVAEGGPEARGYVQLKDNEDWPTDDLRSADAIHIDWTAGYGTTHSDVPEDLKQPIKLLGAHWFEHRQSVVADGSMPREVPDAYEKLMWKHRVRGVP